MPGQEGCATNLVFSKDGVMVTYYAIVDVAKYF
jgi:hypothetical protein